MRHDVAHVTRLLRILRYVFMQFRSMQNIFIPYEKIKTIVEQKCPHMSYAYIILNKFEGNFVPKCLSWLTRTRPIGLPPHAPVAQKSADQR